MRSSRSCSGLPPRPLCAPAAGGCCGLGCPAISSRKCPGSRLRSEWRWHWLGSSSWWAGVDARSRGPPACSGAGAGPLSAPAVCFARAGLLGPAEQKRERWGGGDRERQGARSDPHGPNALQPQAARLPRAPIHSLAEPALALQPRRVAGPLRPGKGAQRMRSGARRRPGEGQPVAEWRRARASLDSNCPRPSFPAPAPRGPGLSCLPPPTPRPSGPESLAGGCATPAGARAGGAAVLGLRSEQGLSMCSASPWKGQLGARRVWSLHRDPPAAQMPSRQRARPEEGLEAGALDIRRERKGRDAASQPVKGDCGYNHLTLFRWPGAPSSRCFPHLVSLSAGQLGVSLSPLSSGRRRRPERLEDSPEATRLISGRAPF